MGQFPGRVFSYQLHPLTFWELKIETQNHIYALEIKWGEKYRADWTQALSKFSKLVNKKPVTQILIYRGNMKMKDKEVFIFPFSVFLNQIEGIIVT